MAKTTPRIPRWTRFGRLRVWSGPFYIEERSSGRRRAAYMMLCDCGTKTQVTSNNLRQVQSCGCLQRERASQNRLRHGESKTRLHSCWKSMRQRCLTTTGRHYKWYGAQGITVDPRWDSYETFRDWALANGYADNLTLERREPWGPYSPENCEWITKSENSRRAQLWRWSQFSCDDCEHRWGNPDDIHCSDCHKHIASVGQDMGAAGARHRCR